MSKKARSLVERINKDVKGSLTVLLILKIIERGEKPWGYEIKQQLAEITGNEPIKDSTMYTALRALENTYMLVESEMKERQRHYWIREDGKSEIEQAKNYWWEIFRMSRKAFENIGKEMNSVEEK